MIHPEMEDYRPLKNIILHLVNIYLIFSRMPYYEYTLEPCNGQYPHNARTAFYLWVRCLPLWYLAYQDLWLFRNRLILFHGWNLIVYFKAWDLYGQSDISYAKLKLLWQYGIHSTYRPSWGWFQIFC